MYAINEDNSIFYVDINYDVPNVLKIVSENEEYYACVPKDGLLGEVADCLNDAERIMAVFAGGTWLENHVNSVACDYTEGVGNPGLIGDDDETDFAVVNSVDVNLSNSAVNPDVGEAYYIYDISQRDGFSPYHAGAVIAKDENYNYILETFDGYDGYNFNRYEISSDGENTFHAHWLQRYYDGIGKTIKIKYFPQDLPEVEYEEEPIDNSENYSYFSSEE